jgi:hypothetical protein
MISGLAGVEKTSIARIPALVCGAGANRWSGELMKLIKFTAEDGDWLAINADQIEHVRYRQASADSISKVEIMFVGNPERTLFEGRMAEKFWELLSEQQ